MGIQLPPELASVAAQAGVAWPEADEDRLRQQAQAWRDAGTKLTNLTRDADHTASNTLHAVTGQTGDAARRHWSTFVAPDTGHLTAGARGCHAAADRLDHAAHQVGTAKVEIVRNLVALAKNSDAAHQAANAGYPNALLGLDTAVRATNANVANINNSLATAVVPGNVVDMNTVQPVANQNPGHHGPLETVSTVVTETTQGATQLAPGTAHDLAQVPADPVQPLPADVRDLPGQVRDTLAHPGDAAPGGIGAPGDPGLGHPDTTGPVRIPPDAPGRGPADLPADAPTPPTGIPAAPGQTVQAGLAGPLLDPSAPAQVSPGAVAAPGGGAPAAGAGPAAPALGAGPGIAAGGGPGPAAPSAPPPAGGGAGIAGPQAPARPVGGAVGGVPVPVQGGGGQAAPPPPSAPAADGPRGRGPLTTAVPPGPQATPPPPPAPPVPRERHEQGAFLFWVHMFPIGHMPVVSDRPARQLPAPPAEVDFAPGLRFSPGDHPEHDQVRATPAELVAVPYKEPLPEEHPSVRAIVEGHDPLGGQHERDWDRRFLVRLGSVTPQGISNAGKEYAWPPGESYPEGGTAAGDPEVLAAGTVIDRFGSPRGRVFSAEGTAFARRSLPPELLAAGYHRYRVLRDLPVWRTISAPWFGQPGGGERYRATFSAAELVALGYLEDNT